MKKILLLFLLAASLQKTFAQEPCGTVVTDEVRTWLLGRQVNLQQRANKTASMLYVPVRVHIVGDNNGNGYYNAANTFELVCELNIHFKPLNIVFYINGPVTYINNSNYYNPTLPYAGQMMNLNNFNNVCNIYMVPQLTGLCGYTYFPSSGPDHGKGGVVLKNSCALPGNTDPTHEMGHYFGLLHTFQDWNNSNAELVNGSNCATKGDLFCDTPADYLDNRWNCPYTGNHLDANGDPYHPDSSLFMSYSNAPCPNRFSPMQQNAIIYSRIHDRMYLDSIPVPAFAVLSPVSLLAPVNNATNVPSSDSALFTWNKVAGATNYNLRIKVSTMPSFTNSTFNILTTDTFARVNGFLVANTYNWKVLPLSYAQTCANCDSANSQMRSFNVVYQVTGIDPYTKEIGGVKLFPNPASSEHFITVSFALQKASSLTIRMADVNGRTVYNKALSAVSGENSLQIPLTMAEGVYALTIASENFTTTQRFIKLD